MTGKKIALISWIIILVDATLMTFIRLSDLSQKTKATVLIILITVPCVSLAIFWILNDYQPKILERFEKKIKIRQTKTP